MGSERTKSVGNDTTIDSKYIQQHLANERTYLAWIRTAIAIIGVGFLVLNMHENMAGSFSVFGDVLAHTIGIFSACLGISTIVMATIIYQKKVTSINNQTFVSSKKFIIALSVFIILIAILFGIFFTLS